MNAPAGSSCGVRSARPSSPPTGSLLAVVGSNVALYDAATGHAPPGAPPQTPPSQERNLGRKRVLELGELSAARSARVRQPRQSGNVDPERLGRAALGQLVEEDDVLAAVPHQAVHVAQLHAVVTGPGPPRGRDNASRRAPGTSPASRGDRRRNGRWPPSNVAVPLPNSSSITSDLSVAFFRIEAVSSSSTMNVLWPSRILSDAPKRVNTRSTGCKVQDFAFHEAPDLR